MTLLKNLDFSTRRQAVEFLLRDLHMLIRPEVADWFRYIQNCFSQSELEEKGQQLVAREVRKNYPRGAEWFPEPEYIVAPFYKFLTTGPLYCYDFSLSLYLVAPADVEWKGRSQNYTETCAVIEIIKKDIEKFKLPLNFLEAVARNDLKQFQQVERDNRGYYTWHIPSLDLDVRLHGLLLKCLENAFRGKPLGPTLVYYGLANWEEGEMAEQSLLAPHGKGALVGKEAPPSGRLESGKQLTKHK